MKIKKNQLLEKVLIEAEETDTLSDINPQEASVTDIADAIENTVDEISDGETSVTGADSAASEIKAAATDLNAGAVVLDTSVASDEEEALGVVNELTKKLDLALKTALSGRRQKNNKNANVLITGLPGSGKTSIVFDWARSSGHGINVFDVSASDPDLEAAVYGLTLRDITATDRNATTKATSDFLDALDRPNSVLFLDEFNRANAKLRRALLMLVNEHAVNDKSQPDGLRKFPNLLFTVAAVNPGGLRFDKNAESLNDAEKSRFAIKVPKFDSNAATTIDYFTKHWDRLIKRLDKNDPYYMQDLEEYLRCQDLGIYLVSSADFNYDSVDDIKDLSDLNKTMLNQREITDGLNISAGDKTAFIEWVKENSDFLQKNIDMILKILSYYNPPTLEELIKRKERQLKTNIETSAPSTVDTNVETNTDVPSDDTFSDDEDIEDDDDFFGTAASGKTAITPGEVEKIAMDIMNNLNW